MLKPKKGTIKAWIRSQILSTVVAISIILVLTYGITSAFRLSANVVASSSMVPTLQIGDIIIAQYVNSEAIQKGDIIVFYSPKGELIVHRVYNKLQVNGEISFQTKGDNNPYPDPWKIAEEHIVGKVVLTLPRLGLLVLLVNRLLLIVLIIVLFSISVVYDYLEWKKKVERAVK